jgi:hypothetical protein
MLQRSSSLSSLGAVRNGAFARAGELGSSQRCAELAIRMAISPRQAPSIVTALERHAAASILLLLHMHAALAI